MLYDEVSRKVNNGVPKTKKSNTRPPIMAATSLNSPHIAVKHIKFRFDHFSTTPIPHLGHNRQFGRLPLLNEVCKFLSSQKRHFMADFFLWSEIFSAQFKQEEKQWRCFLSRKLDLVNAQLCAAAPQRKY